MRYQVFKCRKCGLEQERFCNAYRCQKCGGPIEPTDNVPVRLGWHEGRPRCTGLWLMEVNNGAFVGVEVQCREGIDGKFLMLVDDEGQEPLAGYHQARRSYGPIPLPRKEPDPQGRPLIETVQ